LRRVGDGRLVKPVARPVRQMAMRRRMLVDRWGLVGWVLMSDGGKGCAGFTDGKMQVFGTAMTCRNLES